MDYRKPIPLKNQDNKPYWDGADRHELMLQKCHDCGQYAHPPGPSCVKCGSQNLGWEEFGKDVNAKIYSYVITNRPFLPGFEEDIPLIIAQAELEQVPEVKIMCNVLQCKPEDIQIGMPVKMVWVDITEERTIPQWVPDESYSQYKRPV